MEQNADKYLLPEFVGWCLEEIGRPINGTVSKKFIALFILHLVLLIQIIVLQLLPWKDINSRFLALEECNVVIFVVICFFDLGFSFYKVNYLIRLFEESDIYNHLPLSDEQKKIKTEHVMNEKSTVKRFSYICFSYAVVNTLPCLFGIYEINFADVETISERDIRTPFKCWYPFSIKTNVNYIAAVIPQILCRYFSAYVYLIWFISCIGRLQTLSVEIKMLTSYVLEMNHRLGESPAESSLKAYVSHLVNHHVIIIKSIEKFNKSSGVFFLSVNQVQVFELCVVLYCLLEDTGISLKIRYCIVLVCLLLIMRIMCGFGQLLTDEGENLCLALERTSWIDKSFAHKKSLLIMITCAQKPIEIIPAGLFVINNKNITKVLQAGYSYLNLMRQVKKV